MSSSSSPAGVAIVTGGSSGIGLALTKHLLEKSWAVAVLDVNPPKEELPSSTTKFIKADASSWNDLASAFETVFDWHGGRLDFVALNAGIDDRDDIFYSTSNEKSRKPRKPNMATFDVNVQGPYYGLKLAAHYFSLNTVPGGKVVITASAAGLYALAVVPQYTATKHALVGLTRSLAPIGAKFDVSINCICPALVATGLAPAGLMDNFTEKEITPMSTIIRAFDELAGFDGVKDREAWVKGGHRGQVVEAKLGECLYRQEHGAPTGAENTRSYLSMKAWTNAYLERNKRFADMDWERQS